MDNNQKNKIAIIGFANIYLMPYIKRVRALMDDMGIKYDIIYWDREDINEDGDNLYAYREIIDSSKHIVFKLLAFFRYRRYVLNILKRKEYDKIFVFYTIPAVLIKRYLAKNNKNNYIFAYSDYTFENFAFYKKQVAEVVADSYATTVTSLGFTCYLPKDYDYLISHNCGNYSEVMDFVKSEKEAINITYAGMVRDIEHIKRQINVFGYDSRFVMHFYGSGLCIDELKAYIKDNSIDNVLVHGRFTQDEKAGIMQEADIINNSLANDNFQRQAMTNRMYDAVFHTIPQIVTEGSYSAEVVSEYDIGMSVDLDDGNCADKVYDWIMNIDYSMLSDGCRMFAKEIIADMDMLTKKYIEYLK